MSTPAPDITVVWDLAQRVEIDIYILSGVFGSLIFILICFVTFVVNRVEKLEKKLQGFSGTGRNRAGLENAPAGSYDDIEKRFSQYPPPIPVRAKIDDRYENVGRSYTESSYNQRNSNPMSGPMANQQVANNPAGRSAGFGGIPPGPQQQQQQPRGLRNYDNYGY